MVSASNNCIGTVTPLLNMGIMINKGLNSADSVEKLVVKTVVVFWNFVR